MPTSSRKVGPAYATIRVMIQRYPDHVTWDLMLINHNGPTTRQGRISSGNLPIGAVDIPKAPIADLVGLAWVSMVNQAQPAAPPDGGHGGDPTLNLDFSQ